jgi:acid stress chaperone HdeB
MKNSAISVVAILALCCMTVTVAQAQLTIDVSKITCDQFRTYKVANPNYIAIWLHAYYSSKRDNTVVEVQSFKDDFDKLNEYCITRLSVPVMDAAKTLFAK